MLWYRSCARSLPEFLPPLLRPLQNRAWFLARGVQFCRHPKCSLSSSPQSRGSARISKSPLSVFTITSKFSSGNIFFLDHVANTSSMPCGSWWGDQCFLFGEIGKRVDQFWSFHFIRLFKRYGLLRFSQISKVSFCMFIGAFCLSSLLHCFLKRHQPRAVFRAPPLGFQRGIHASLFEFLMR